MPAAPAPVEAVPVVTEPAPVLRSTSAPVPAPPPLRSLADADTIPRRVPVPVPRPPLDLCVATGVTLDAASRVVVVRDQGGVGAELERRLAERGVTTLVLDAAQPTETITDALDGWLAGGPLHGIYWLPALDAERALARDGCRGLA